MNTERRKFLKTLALGGGFLLLSKVLAPFLHLRERELPRIMFSDSIKERIAEKSYSVTIREIKFWW